MSDVVKMDPKKKEALKRDTQGLKDKVEETNSKLDMLIRSAKKHTTIIEGFGFELEIYSAMPGPIKEMAASEFNSKEDEDPLKQYQKEVDISARILAAMCVDPELRSVEAWVKFENETGLLRDLITTVVKETSAPPEDIKSFRRKSARADVIRPV